MPDEDETASRPPFTEAMCQEVRDLVAELFGITGEEDPLIDMPMIAELAGVAPGTPGAWQQRYGADRSVPGAAVMHPFPEPHDGRYLDKPQWRAVSFVRDFLYPTGRWPRGTVARESTRVTKRYTFSQLKKAQPELAEAIKELGAVDDKPRSVQGWRSHRTRASKAASRPAPKRLRRTAA
jgi:hypothetical protein